jgi:leader peptidase (prepilin peptidase)/N-methyltransferase
MTTDLFRPALAGANSIAPALLVVAALVTAAAVAAIDWRTHRVPDALVILAAVPVLVALPVLERSAHRLVGLLVGAALMALPLLIVHVVSPAAMGFGDVKLAAALGTALGVMAPSLALPALAAGAGLTLLIACCTRRVAVPFAPGLVLGTGAVIALGSFEGWQVAP